MINAEVRIGLKKGVVDAEGRNIKKAMALLGYHAEDVQSEKVYKISLNVSSNEEAKKLLEDACQKLLANPVVNDYSIKIVG